MPKVNIDTVGNPPKDCSRDSIEDIWGPRTPYVHQWPTRVDHACDETPDKWVQSACVLCSNGCGLDLGVKDGKVVGVRGRAVDRVNKGRLGPKGLNGWKAIHSKDRLTHPLIRRNGKLEEATWDEAMDLIVKKSKELVEKLTAHSIAFYTSGQLLLEEYYVLALIGKAGLNTLHMDGNTRLCTATAAAAMRESFGSDGQPGSYTDIDYTDCIFMVGHNMAATQTVLWSRILDRLAGPHPPKLIVVDPRYSESASKATVHLAPKIGTNLALLNGIQHLLFKNNWINDDYISKHVVGIEDLKNTVKGYDPERVSQITGVPVSKLEEAAQLIGQTPSLLSSALQGVYQSNQATASACQINNIHLLRGLLGKPGSGIFQMNGQPTAQNNRETGCDGEFPGFRNHQNAAHMQDLADLWNIESIKVPHWNQPTHIHNMLNFMEKGSIRMVWVSGTNPLVSLPNLAKIRDIFTMPELFVVCQDLYMTETAAVADVVLPAAQTGEKTGCFTNVDRTVHLSHKAVDPPGQAKADLDIFLDYSRRMGFKNKDGGPLTPWTEPEEVFKAWQRLSAGRPCDYSGMSYAKLTGGSGLQWPCNEDYPVGKERLFDDGIFFTDINYCESYGHDLQTGVPYSEDYYKELRPAGRAILKACDYVPPYEDTDDEYPLRLSTGRNVFQFHTRTKTGRTALQNAAPDPEIRISEKDAPKYDLKTGDMVLVKSRRGQVEVKVKIGKISQGQAFIPFHFGYFDLKDGRARAANELTITEWDPISKQPTFKSGAISIQKIPSDGTVPVAKEQQSAAVARAENYDADDSKVTKDDLDNRERQLETWLGEAFEAIILLKEITEELFGHLIHDSEAHSGLRILIQITKDTIDQLQPHVEKFGENQARGKHTAHLLRDALFPKSDTDKLPAQLQVLEALRSLQVYLAHLRVGLDALNPVSQAMWDGDFFDAVIYAISQVKRMQDWVTEQIKVRAPQALLVPCKVE
ncbi:uncharacterized protein FIESC28_10029 [Fusarium coffeatum]|uniref:4Fe-4S Mo/W bis-MGD-type domain-containing protein n=1 Tax=Fusarium coffeatum TaxID=231269 RepID=A0A366QW16_9HYPO|nr:uncharacterized protein FIESC28_10029 [Fusarium coffeatum]RBR09089.1 hypothetical protein FIESC28_10029 [Fusarium coffeatum]